jgi:hypothetical protein
MRRGKGLSAIGRLVTERTSTKPKAKTDRATAGARNSLDAPQDLIASFADQVRVNGLDLARRIGPVWPTFVERLREVADEIALEAERWEKEVHRPEEMPGIPEFLRRT